MRHRLGSIAGLLFGDKQILATWVSQILEAEVFLHKVIKTKNQVQKQWPVVRGTKSDRCMSLSF